MPYERALFFEGTTDLHPVGHFLDLKSYRTEFFNNPCPSPETIGLRSFGGYSNLRKGFPLALQQESTLTHVGIIADADTDPSGRWQSLCDALQDAGSVEGDLPAAPVEEGWTGTVELADRFVQVGLWMMPDNGSEGAVESFLLKLIPEEDTLLPRAKACLASIPEEERLFEPRSETKALIRTWLAWQEDPGPPLGTAVNSVFDTDALLATRFADWATRLFPA